MAMLTKAFSDLIDFTRTSSATYVGSDGLIKTTPASKNRMVYTQEFDNGAWVKSAVSITANTATAPDGSLTADTLNPSAAAGAHQLRSNTANPLAATQQAFSVYAKAAGGRFLQLSNNTSNTIYANFDLINGTVGSFGSATSASIVAAGDGWYRCVIVATPATAGNMSLLIPSSATSIYNQSWTPTGAETVYIWGAQVEVGAAATSYTRNFGGVYPARFNYDPATLAPKGFLLEEQRTNLLKYSAQLSDPTWTTTNATVTADQLAAPDGTVTADKIVGASSAMALRNTCVIQSATMDTGTIYTFSVFLAAGETPYTVITFDNNAGIVISFNVDLSTGTASAIYYAGVSADAADRVVLTGPYNGFYRIQFTFKNQGYSNARIASSANAPVANGNLWWESDGDGVKGIYAWGAQVEAGPFVTSYIPTVGSQVTRTVDSAAINAANFSSWFSQGAGTIVVEAEIPQLAKAAYFHYILCFANADGSTRLFLRTYTATPSFSSAVAGVAQSLFNLPGTTVAATNFKMAAAFAENDFAATFNGGSPGTDTSGTVGSFTRLILGAYYNSTGIINGHIRSIRYYPTRLSNPQLQSSAI